MTRATSRKALLLRADTTHVAVLPAVDSTAPQQRSRILIVAPLDSLGKLLAGDIHGRLAVDAAGRPIYIIPQRDFEATMQAAGFTSISPALGSRDVRALASLLRADVVLAFGVSVNNSGVRVDGQIATGRSLELRRLATSEDKFDRVGAQIVQSLRADSAYQRLLQRQP
jgi:hypothetical protein